MVIAVLGMLFGLMEFFRIKKLPAHKSMLEVSDLIYETCKTYLFQQGKFLAILEVLHRRLHILLLLRSCKHMELPKVSLILTLVRLGHLGFLRSCLVRNSN